MTLVEAARATFQRLHGIREPTAFLNHLAVDRGPLGVVSPLDR